MITESCRCADRPIVKALEPRCLLSAGGNIDTSFGDGGYITGADVQALIGGSIVAANTGATPDKGPEALISPDGRNIQTYTGTVPQPPPQNVQSDGKFLVLANGVLTRFNADASIDKTFGSNGSVSNFDIGDPNHFFTPEKVVVNGLQIYVLGEQHPTSDPFSQSPSVEHLTSNGSIDSAYGNNGIAVYPFSFDGNPDLQFAKFGLDGELYTEWDMDGQPTVIRFSQAGAIDGSYIISVDASADQVFGLEFQQDGKLLVLASPGADNVSLIRFDHNLNPDPTFGNAGIVKLAPQFGIMTGIIFSGKLLVRGDGEILATVADLGQGPDFTVAFSPDAVPNSGAVSGRFFNDLNTNHKQDKNEPGLAYWQAYADLNNNGVFDFGEPSGFANVHGDYTIKNLLPGTYFIREVRQQGWTRTLPGGTWPTAGFYKVHVSANKTVTGLDFGNTDGKHAKGSISGTIFNDVNGDRFQDNGETGLAGWQAYVDVNNNGIHDSGEPIATSDTNGHYKITGLFEGGYVVREIRKSGWSRTTPPGAWPAGLIEVNLAAGATSTGNDFGNVHAKSATVKVFGVVFNDTNGNGKLDSGETGVGGIQVLLWKVPNPGIPWLITTTAADGSFSFNDLAPGTYFLEATDNMNFQADGPQFTLLPGQSFQESFVYQP